MQRIQTYEGMTWRATLPEEMKHQLVASLESGQVIYFPELATPVPAEQWPHLAAAALLPGVKNISYDSHTGAIKGLRHQGADNEVLLSFVRQFAQQAVTFVRQLLPWYSQALQIGRTSYRSVEIANRVAASKRKDDRLLHVDAFPATPTGGKRILRLFVNINPHAKERLWRLGEPLSAVIERFAPTLKNPLPISRGLLQLLRVTRGYRTLYDHYMLQLHDTMKMANNYQQTADQIQFGFPAHSAWLVFTDRVSHAALAGQHLLEQTFYVPVTALQDIKCSPLAMLKQHYQKELLD